MVQEEINRMDKYYRYKTLDNVLMYLYTYTQDTPATLLNIQDDNPHFRTFSNRDRMIILEKLTRDCYIGVKESFNSLGDTGYYITFEGLLLLDDGGYVSKKKKESISKVLQSWQTWVIAVGAILGSLYGLFEIWKYFHEC